MTYAKTAADLTVDLPSSGAKMPLLGLGTWQLRGSACRQAVGWALEVGYRHVDTATMYGNESEVGAAIAASGLERAEIFVTTKMPPERAGGRELRTLQDSLRALGTDYVDLWLVHWPPGERTLVRTWQGMLAARDDGLVTSVGVSNHRVAEIDRLVGATGEAPAVNQIPWAPSRFDGGLLRAMRERDVVLEGYSPFKNTNLRASTLVDIARRHAVTPAQVVLRWHVQHEVVVIPKSATVARIGENFDVWTFDLSSDEMRAIDALGR